nr:putative uncharacterized protein C5orf58 homolog [Neomonachus schauinslandi]
MFKNNVPDHELNVEAIIKNINTISSELKKMKAAVKGDGTAKTSLGQSGLTAGAGERITSDGITLYHQKQEGSAC